MVRAEGNSMAETERMRAGALSWRGFSSVEGGEGKEK